MISRTNAVASLSLLTILSVGVFAQNPQPTPDEAKPREFSRQKRVERTTTPLERLTNLQGFGTTGRIPKFGGGDYLVNSASRNIGVSNAVCAGSISGYFVDVP